MEENLQIAIESSISLPLTAHHQPEINNDIHDTRDTTTSLDTSIENAPRTVTTLCSHLSHANLEMAKDAVRRRTTREASPFVLADFALSGLVSMRPAFQANRALDSIILRNWPSILAWMQFYVQLAKRDPVSPEEMQRIVSLLARAVWAIGEDSDMFMRMTSTGDAKKLLVQLWLLEDTKQPLGGFPSASALLFRFFCTRDTKDNDYNLVLAESGGKASRLAEIILSRLYDAIDQVPRAVPVVLVHIRLITALITTNNPLAFIAFKRGVFSHLARLLLELSEMPLELGSPSFEAIELLFSFLTDYQPPGSGNRWILQSLQHGLLPAIMNCSPLFESFAASNLLCVKTFMRIRLPSYLVFWSVLDAVASGWKDVTKTMDSKIGGSVVADEWQTFKDIYLERMVLKCSYDKVRDENPLKSRCMICGKIDEKTEFKRCAGCNKVQYCSKECQRIDWKTGGHKEECAQLKDTEDGDTMRLTSRDHRFLESMAVNVDALRHYPALRSLSSRRYPGTPFDSVAVFIDYTFVPPRIDVISHTDLKARYAGVSYEAYIARAIQDAKATNGQMAVVGYSYPAGDHNNVATDHTLFRTQAPATHGKRDREKLSFRRRMSFVDNDSNPVKALWDETDEFLYRGELTTDILSTANPEQEIRKRTLDALEVMELERKLAIFRRR